MGKIQFKGLKDGIYLQISEKKLDNVLDKLQSKLSNNKDFFEGAKVIGIESHTLSYEEKVHVLNVLKYKYDFDLSDDAYTRFEKPKEEEVFGGIEEGLTKFVRNTVRSGQVIAFKGNVVIIGDVNPGGLVQADGNIIVLGCLKGIVHAGYNGNRDAIVGAYDLGNAMQIRIADMITRKPDDDNSRHKDKCPEVAKIEGGRIYIEPYLYKKS